MKIEEFLAAPAAELPTLPVRHLSATSVSMFMRCPEQFRRRYILHEKERPGAALIIGRGFHAAQELNFAQKIHSGEDLPITEQVEAYHAGWDAEVEKSGGVDEILWDDREKPDTLRTKGAKLVETYAVQVAPKLQPVAVEQEFNLVLEDVAVPFNGYLDFVGEVWPSPLEAAAGAGALIDEITGKPIEWLPPIEEQEPTLIVPTNAVVDYKTARAVKRELKPEWLLQARLYQLQTGLRVEYHVAAKTKDPQIVTPFDAPALGIDPQEQALKVTTRLLQRVSKQIAWHYSEFGPDQAWPGAITHPWACGFCGYRPNCMWWAT